ncbi:MAG: FAD-binding protein [Vampirovibrio sp.]|nr:FAD-binding protein [Vampirovibrio sp.]
MSGILTEASRSEISASALGAFEKIVGARYVLSRAEELATYECDACLLVKTRPQLVVLPKTTEEVAEVVKVCRQYQLPFIARGAGTGLSGGALAIEGGVIIGLNRMDSIRHINVDNRTATVEVGVVNGWLNEALKPYDLFFAPDPSSQSACTLGGNIAENAGGIHCIKYGVTTDHILSLEVVLPDGSVMWTGSASRRHHGINLTGVMVGSEGTMGIVTQAVVRLLPKPQAVRVYMGAFSTVESATRCVSEIIAKGLTPSALEFMDAFTVKAVNDAFDVGFPEDCQAVLLVELDGTAEGLASQESLLVNLMRKANPSQLLMAESEADRAKLWKARKLAVAAYGRILPAFYLHDCVIPRSQLTTVLTKIGEIAEQYQMTVGNVFHAGDGNLHPNILFDPADQAMVDRIMVGGEEILKVCLSVGGVLSGEHGIGLEKAHYMPLLFSDEDLAKMTALKKLFDPDGLANPAKIFPTGGGCGEVNRQMAPVAAIENSSTTTPSSMDGSVGAAETGLWI